MSKVSVVVPVYFNELNLHALSERLLVLGRDGKTEFEFIFVDDGSEDGSHAILQAIAQKDRRVKIIKLSRNFGSFVAILAGLKNTTGDCVAVISADLQDPPEMIPDMVKSWQEGYKVVLAARKDRKDPLLVRWTSAIFYRLLRRFALKDMPEGGFDFFLIDRKIVEIIAKSEEKNTSLVGLILWLGFKRKILYYSRMEREHGKSMWTLGKRMKYFIDSFVAFSYFPIRLASILGVLVSFFGFLYILVIFYMYFFLVTPPSGWSALMVVILFTSGLQLLIFGILGEYLWRNFDQTRKRPIYVIEETLGVDDPK